MNARVCRGVVMAAVVGLSFLSVLANETNTSSGIQSVTNWTVQTSAAKPEEPKTNKDMTIDLGGGVKMEFVWIEALKGWVGKYEVTNQEYRRFKTNHDSGIYFDTYSLNADRQPVDKVSYDDAVAFADWLSQLSVSNVLFGYKVRLPDEKEWITFAQCGDGRKYPWGNEWPPKYGNYPDATAKKEFFGWTCIDAYDDGAAASCPVEKSGRNDLGLYGVGGNVWEWTTEQRGKERGLRGAAWYGGVGVLKCECVLFGSPSLRSIDTGFRLVVVP